VCVCVCVCVCVFVCVCVCACVCVCVCVWVCVGVCVCVCVAHNQVIDECLKVDSVDRPTVAALLQGNRFANSVGESDAQGREVLRLCCEAHGGRPSVAPRQGSDSSDASGSASLSSSVGAGPSVLLKNTTRSARSDSTSSFNVVESDSKLCVSALLIANTALHKRQPTHH
jgi:hypothetical protein